MKRILFFLVLMVGFVSCEKQVIEPGHLGSSGGNNGNPTPQDSSYSLNGQTWVITKILLTDLTYDDRSDTIYFEDDNNYTFNGNVSTYDLDVNSSNIKLTLNNTAWGNLIGTLYNYNLSSGLIDGSIFNDYFIISYTYRIWMKKI